MSPVDVEANDPAQASTKPPEERGPNPAAFFFSSNVKDNLKDSRKDAETQRIRKDFVKS